MKRFFPMQKMLLFANEGRITAQLALKEEYFNLEAFSDSEGYHSPSRSSSSVSGDKSTTGHQPSCLQHNGLDLGHTHHDVSDSSSSFDSGIHD